MAAVGAAAVMRSERKNAEVLAGAMLGRTWWVASTLPKVDRIEAGRITRQSGWL
ncbi:hypothetical protein [uncultured Sphingomonas sp.]|uniref:hypothetical protein n=1 Tax=uncultured Sphingomonas sp. TaxID=158754 RepID=UPI0025CEF9D1|nr:hypothetical protein [uncultured Sphingomonas sp.]